MARQLTVVRKILITAIISNTQSNTKSARNHALISNSKLKLLRFLFKISNKVGNAGPCLFIFCIKVQSNKHPYHYLFLNIFITSFGYMMALHGTVQVPELLQIQISPGSLEWLDCLFVQASVKWNRRTRF